MVTDTAYQEALQYLYERLPMFSRIGKEAIKHDLTNTRNLCSLLGNPQKNFKSIHIAGTNGKGSTSHALAAILLANGYKTGLYTSPHLIDFRERIRIDGQPVGRQWVVNFLQQHKDIIESVQPSFFEITVAMAFAAFAEEQVDIAVIETGLGGRLDSTNIITPVLSIITNISYDHKDLLGNTLRQIASEKAGIIKPQVPVLIGEQHEETAGVFFETAIHNQSTIYYAEASWDLVKQREDNQYQYYKAVHKARMEMHDLKTDLMGRYQYRNLKTVLAAIDVLIASQGMEINQDKAFSALSRVKKLTGLRGRWEQISTNPPIITDVAHNPAGLKEVLAQFEGLQAKRKHVVLGFVKDKDICEALSLFPTEYTYYFCNAAIPRALPVAELKQLAVEAGLRGDEFPSVAEAVEAARLATQDEEALLITGSFFIVGEALEYFEATARQTAGQA